MTIDNNSAPPSGGAARSGKAGPIERTALDVATLSPAAQKALGPGPGRAMASRGLVPLPPAEQVAVLYQLTLDADSHLAAAARATASGLPDKLLAGTLADARLDVRVLDLFAELAGTRTEVFDALVTNASTADATIAMLASRAGAREIERIAANEQRLLRHPEIIAAMYLNKQARMSTVDRAIELAVRNNVRVPGLAAWDELARALQSGAVQAASAEQDALFAVAAEAASGDDSPMTAGDAEQVVEEDAAEAQPEQSKKLPIEKLTVPGKIRLATLGNGFARAVLIRDPLKLVAMAAIKSTAVTEFEAARYASNQSLTEDVIRFIAGKKEWTKLYGTKVSLCRNPKTPVTEAMRLMPFLRDKDLNNLTKSKGVPSAVTAQARKLLMQRRSGGDKK
jgi:hypothetical protein